jgi:hypothetical protein
MRPFLQMRRHSRADSPPAANGWSVPVKGALIPDGCRGLRPPLAPQDVESRIEMDLSEPPDSPSGVSSGEYVRKARQIAL